MRQGILVVGVIVQYLLAGFPVAAANDAVRAEHRMVSLVGLDY